MQKISHKFPGIAPQISKVPKQTMVKNDCEIQ